jgi:chemotaxis protein histidine kinase CheA
MEGDIPFDALLDITMDIERLSVEKGRFKTTIEKINSFKPAAGNSDIHHQGRYILVESVTKAVNKVSGDMGKKIQFIVDGIDNGAIENGPRRIIKEVLIQLARNSAVHGIEMPKDRVACGKNETGRIRLSIKLIDGNIHIKLGDDGCGINYSKIAEKAMRLKLIKKEDAENRAVLLKAMFSPGFSTVETAGLHAGRGVGLNLIQDRVRSEKGSIKIQTESGKGTIFNILLPAQQPLTGNI